MAITRKGNYGGARSPYGSFAGKGNSGPVTGPVTRHGNYGGARALYGSFDGKTAGIPATTKRSKQFLRTVGRMIR